MQEMSCSASWDPYQMYFPSSQTAHQLVPYSYHTPVATPQTSPDFAGQTFSFLQQLPVPLASSQNGQTDRGEGEKKKARRYKTPTPQILRVRRSAANERERRRMTQLNVAYDKLRTVLPDMDAGRRLSKYETLQMAQAYIEDLERILRSPEKYQMKQE